MKIGDIFTDGGYTYKVIDMHENGLPISKRIETEEKVEETEVEDVGEKVEETEGKKYTKTQINRMALTDLETLCRELELEVGTGTEMKKAIIEYFGL